MAQSRNSISAAQIIALLIQAGEIQSLNYNPAGTPPFSAAGTRIDLVNGNFQTPSMFIDGATGALTLKGSLIAGEVRSANYNAAGTPPFAAAGTRIDLSNGDIKSTALFVNGATGALSVRGVVTATSFTAVMPGGSIADLVVAAFTDSTGASRSGFTLGASQALGYQRTSAVESQFTSRVADPANAGSYTELQQYASASSKTGSLASKHAGSYFAAVTVGALPSSAVGQVNLTVNNAASLSANVEVIQNRIRLQTSNGGNGVILEIAGTSIAAIDQPSGTTSELSRGRRGLGLGGTADVNLGAGSNLVASVTTNWLSGRQYLALFVGTTATVTAGANCSAAIYVNGTLFTQVNLNTAAGFIGGFCAACTFSGGGSGFTVAGRIDVNTGGAQIQYVGTFTRRASLLVLDIGA